MRVLRISDIIAKWMAFKLHTVWTENRDKQREGRGHRERQSEGVSVESLCCQLRASTVGNSLSETDPVDREPPQHHTTDKMKEKPKKQGISQQPNSQPTVQRTGLLPVHCACSTYLLSILWNLPSPTVRPSIFESNSFECTVLYCTTILRGTAEQSVTLSTAQYFRALRNI